jgi:hypothetical protein
MDQNSDEVVTTEDMIAEAAGTGDLEQLEQFARQGMRVTTGAPLSKAIKGGSLEVMRFLVEELGADVNRVHSAELTPLIKAVLMASVAVVQCLVIELGADINQASGLTPLTMAASQGDMEMVSCLVQLGAKMDSTDEDGNTALHVSACDGHLEMLKFLAEQGDAANIAAANNKGETVWDLLKDRIDITRRDDVDGNVEEVRKLAELKSLVRVLVLRGMDDLKFPACLVVRVKWFRRIVLEGGRLKDKLPAYLVQRRALLDANCPMLLPPLRALVHGYMELTTTEELWATGLGDGAWRS